MKKQILFLIATILTLNVGAQNNDFKYEANWESIRSHYRVSEWFRDAKFGVFVIWGPHSVPHTGSEKYGKFMYADKTIERFGINMFQYHREHFGDQSEFGYKDFIPQFTMENYNPEEWAQLFKKAGARYVVPMADFHDNYALHATKLTRWNVVETGPKKDIMQMLADAVRKEGMKFGMSSHLALTRIYYPKKNPKWDTADQRYADLYGDKVEPNSKPTQKFLDMWWQRTTEVIDNYQPDLMWFDFGLDKPGFEPVHAPILAYYYNKGLEWGKEVVFQDKNMKNRSFPEDLIVLDIERGRMDSINPLPWQTDTSVGKLAWGYTSGEKYKSSDYLIDEFVDIVSKNGCLLLAIGPKADGTIAVEARKILTEIGDWLHLNGEAIYGTRPWKIYGEGPTRVSSGHHSEAQNTENVAADIRFTTKGDTLYAISLGWPDDGIINIKSLKAGNKYDDRPIKNIEFLSGANKIYWKKTHEELKIFVKGKKPCKAAFAFRITFWKEGEKGAPKAQKYVGLFNRRPMVVERYRPPQWNELVPGGQFIDRFEPLPVMGKLTSDTWGNDAVKPRYTDNGLEDPAWTYWGGNALKGKDGKYHMIICRWPSDAPHGHWHYHQSMVVHAISENPFGPYKVIQTLFPGHNPHLIQMKDGRYIIKSGLALWVESDKESEFPVLEPLPGIADNWEYYPMKMDMRRRYSREQAPMAFAQREDGSFLMCTRHGDIWVSQTGTSTYYRVTDKRVYPTIEGRFEDPVIWRSNVQYHLITHDWQGRIAYHMRSKDGFHWKLDDGVAYQSGVGLGSFEDGTKNDWHKYEVIRINQDEYGRAERVTFAAIDCLKGEDLGDDNHNSKNLILPLTKGKLLSVLNETPISPFTKEIKVKIQAEDDFNPHTDINLSSLRFGVSEEVNYGRGCRLKKTQKSGKDLILIFDGTGNKFTKEHFAGKLIGKTNGGKLLFGYSRLPGVNHRESFLSALPAKFKPYDGGVEVEVEIQNLGLAPSTETPVVVQMREGDGNLYEMHLSAPPLKPYEKTILRGKRPVETWKPKKGAPYNVSVIIENPGQEPEIITRETVVLQ